VDRLSLSRARPPVTAAFRQAVQEENGAGRPEGIPSPPAIVGQSQPLRILHVVNSLGLGGTEQGILKISAGLDPALFDQRICPLRGADAALAESAGMSARLLLPARQDVHSRFSIPRLIRAMRLYRPHIVHSRNWGAIEAIVAGRIAGVPVVVHSEHGYEVEMLSGLPLRRRWIRRATYPLCDAVFTVTRDLRQYHSRQAWYSPEKIGVIPNGVDTKLFAPDLRRRGEARGALGLRDQDLVVGTVGRMVQIKDQRTLLAAIKNAVGHGCEIQGILIGDGPELGNLQRMAEDTPELRGRIRFPGRSLRVSELFPALDVFVLPSISEGMSNTLLEAMAAGIACVATNVGGNPEIVEDDVGGMLFRPGDVVVLGTALQQLARQPELRARFATAGRNRALKDFSIERMLQSYASLYLGLAKNLVTRTRMN
jgi:sugar transferase (PEP-CTERM/EpsH1 system associated)